MAAAADTVSSLPIQRRRTSLPAGSASSPLTSLRAGPTGSFRMDSVPAEPIRRWADATPTMAFTPVAEDSRTRLARKGSMETPSMLFPPTPSPMASYTSFGLHLSGVPEGGATLQGVPVAQAQPTGVFQQCMVPSGQMAQMVFVQMPAPMQPAGSVSVPPAVQHVTTAAPVPMQVMAAPMPTTTVVAAHAPVQHMPVATNGSAMASVTQESEIVELQEPPHDVIHLAGRQLFGEALDSAILDETAPPSQPLPSPGSAPHGTGRCNPCAWFWKPKGCQNGGNCAYCHLCPEGELKNRKKAKVAALRMGAIEPVEQSKGGTGGQQPAALKLTTLL